ncbi:putative membrane fusion protein [Desulfitispora alkaliphila]|uniref:HlyD family efflux transporter periplasmic adaptor subunit n=1 Tax=Desulfitispora alkaliphila TaxID=622674 RepID=UPI003D22076B
MSRRKRLVAKNKKKKLRKALLLVFLIMLLAIVGKNLGVYVIDKVKQMNLSLAETQWGLLEEAYDSVALLGKDEIVLYSPASGTVELKVQPGERVAVGQVVAEIKGGFNQQFSERTIHKIKAPKSGIVSLEIDGLEYAFKKNEVTQMNYSQLQDRVKEVKSLNLTEIEQGAPILKIINNLANVVAVITTEGLYDKVSIGESYKIRVEDCGVINRAVLLDKQIGGDKEHLVIEILNYSDPILYKRLHNIELILEDYEGVIIEEHSLVNIDGESNILLIQTSGRAEWHPVDVIGKIGDKVAVRGVPLGMMYITDPDID